jgi:uncharacterized protein with PQ loop repeat
LHSLSPERVELPRYGAFGILPYCSIIVLNSFAGVYASTKHRPRAPQLWLKYELKVKNRSVLPIALRREATMQSNPASFDHHASNPEAKLRRVIGGMSIFTLLMTIPQVLTIWVGHQAAGVSIFTWSAYLFSAILWFWFGVQKQDKNIYLPCIGWIALDTAVIVGALIYG